MYAWPSVVVCTKFETKEYTQVDRRWWSQSSIILIPITSMNGTIYSSCPLVGRHLLFNFLSSVDWFFFPHCLLILIFTAYTDTCWEWQKSYSDLDRSIIIYEMNCLNTRKKKTLACMINQIEWFFFIIDFYWRFLPISRTQ